MAPLSQALRTHRIRQGTDGTQVYGGDIDAEWTVGAVPHGGYLLSLILDACLQAQASTSHPDAIHLSSHFLQTTSVAPFEIKIRILRTGKQVSNLTAELSQTNGVNITCHFIFGTLPEVLSLSSKDERKYSLVPPHPFARHIPLTQHPSTLPLQPVVKKLTFNKHLGMKRDSTLVERLHARKEGKEAYNEGVESGEWFELLSEEKGSELSGSMIPFFADISRNAPGLLPADERPFGGDCWYPTLTLAMDFKARIPHSASKFAPLQLGVYSSGRFIHEGRHETYVEVWTAPASDNADEGKWVNEMACLAIGTQMALTRPLSVNIKKKGGKL